MKNLVEKRGMADRFHIESAATSTEELGNPVYPPARRKLEEHGISCAGKTARQVNKSDYEKFDMIIAMDDYNITNISRILGHDEDNKIHKLLDFTNHPGNVADPWYTGNFDATWRDVNDGCEGILRSMNL